MKKKCNLTAMLVAEFLLLTAGPLSAEVICKAEPPLKPVRCVCGKLVDQSGVPVSGATVKVIQNGKVLEIVKTGGDGKFNFAGLKSGSYELNAQADKIFREFRSQIVVSRPSRKCKHRLVIVLVLGGLENCGSYVMKR
ncbi:MAG TPA: carboxypeptidase-like regulatory domain-containing protein [Bryobacteraceae bacterium]|nr:carboxypeptidase-like regulatory domain-containing protein [Bryobacteraceae bacterium]